MKPQKPERYRRHTGKKGVQSGAKRIVIRSRKVARATTELDRLDRAIFDRISEARIPREKMQPAIVLALAGARRFRESAQRLHAEIRVNEKQLQTFEENRRKLRERLRNPKISEGDRDQIKKNLDELNLKILNLTKLNTRRLDAEGELHRIPPVFAAELGEHSYQVWHLAIKTAKESLSKK